jgi:hypothetical protein
MVKTFSWRFRVRRIFLSYRKRIAGETGHLADRVALELGTGSVFMDVEAFRLNRLHRLRAEIARCDVLLAVIGPRWLELSDDQGNRRFDDSSDIVRIEISTALQRGIPVIPILLNGTKTPSCHRPPDLKILPFAMARKSDTPHFIQILAGTVGSRIKYDGCGAHHRRNWERGQ